MSARARIAFAGTPELAVPALQELVTSGVDVPLVLTQPDRPAGRGRRLAPSPVKRAAQLLGLRVEQPADLEDEHQLDTWGPPPAVLVVVAYGLLLPQWLLDWPGLSCVNVHASLLPRWRGAAPVQHAILAGDRDTGVSIMRMESGLDRGPVYATRSLEIKAQETAGQLHDRLAELGATALGEVLPDILDGSRAAQEQDHRQATYAGKIKKADAPLDWRLTAVTLERRVRAFSPWPVAEAKLTDGRRLRIWRAESLQSHIDASPGTIIAAQGSGIDVATGAGVLRLHRLQPPSSIEMDAAAYLAAHSLEDVSFEC